MNMKKIQRDRQTKKGYPEYVEPLVHNKVNKL